MSGHTNPIWSLANNSAVLKVLFEKQIWFACCLNKAHVSAQQVSENLHSAEDGTINKPVKSWRSQRFSLELYFYPVFLLRVQSECSLILITCGSEACLNLLTWVLIILIKDGVQCVFWCFMPAACPFSYHLFMQIFIWNIYCVDNIFLHICVWSLLAVTEGETLSPVSLSFSNIVANREQGVGDKAA